VQNFISLFQEKAEIRGLDKPGELVGVKALLELGRCTAEKENFKKFVLREIFYDTFLGENFYDWEKRRIF